MSIYCTALKTKLVHFLSNQLCSRFLVFLFFDKLTPFLQNNFECSQLHLFYYFSRTEKKE